MLRELFFNIIEDTAFLICHFYELISDCIISALATISKYPLQLLVTLCIIILLAIG